MSGSRLRLTIPPLVFLLLAFSCLGEVVSDVNLNARAMHRVCVLPAEVSLSKASFHGSTPLPDESDAWTGKLNDALRNIFSTAGAPPVGDFSASGLATQPDLRDALFRLDQRYKNIAVQMQMKPAEISKRRYTLGDEVAILPCSRDSDGIVFVHVTGSLTYYHSRVVQAALDLLLCFVDSTTGEVVALTRAQSSSGRVFNDPQRVYGEILQDSFQRIRVGNFVECRVR